MPSTPCVLRTGPRPVESVLVPRVLGRVRVALGTLPGRQVETSWKTVDVHEDLPALGECGDGLEILLDLSGTPSLLRDTGRDSRRPGPTSQHPSTTTNVFVSLLAFPCVPPWGGPSVPYLRPPLTVVPRPSSPLLHGLEVFPSVVSLRVPCPVLVSIFFPTGRLRFVERGRSRDLPVTGRMSLGRNVSSVADRGRRVPSTCDDSLLS